MKSMLFLGAALLIASPALAADTNTSGTDNETDASMNHVNTADPENPIYDAPATSTSGAAANSNLKGDGPQRDPKDEADGPSRTDTSKGSTSGTSNETDASMNNINTEDPDNPMYDAPSTSTSGAAANSNVVGDGPLKDNKQ